MSAKSYKAVSSQIHAMKPLFLLPLLLCSCASPVLDHGIPNAAWVEPGVMRGGQPNAQGWAYLRSQGITNVIKLNTGKPDTVPAGMTVLWLPMNWVDQTIGKPNPTYVWWAAENIKTGTYVHCSRGQYRTGLVIGYYRVMVEHWSKQQAWAEMRQHGFHPLLRGLMWSWEEDVP